MSTGDDRSPRVEGAGPGRGGLAVVVALLLGVTLALDVFHARLAGNGLSPTADGYSEANALRAGERYAKDGFLVNCGLPEVTYGKRFPGVGITGSSGLVAESGVYHGYPPGSDWLAGVYTRLFGPDAIAVFRVFPVGLAVAASAVFLWGLIRALGPVRGPAVYACCLAAPMFTNMAHSLYFHGYALSLLLVETGVTLAWLSGESPRGLRVPAAVAAVGFLEGWFSFDYCFVVTLCPLVVAPLAAPRGGRVAWRQALVLAVAAGAGFTAAHVLHFFQSVAYFGSVRGALDEFAYRSRKTYALGQRSTRLPTRPELWLGGLNYSFHAFARWTHLFAPALACLLAALVAVAGAGSLPGRYREAGGFRLNRLSWLDFAALGLGLAAAYAWMFAMPFHYINHVTYAGRHLFLFYLAAAVAVARAVERPGPAAGGAPPGAPAGA